MRDDAIRMFGYYAAMRGCYSAMPDDEKEALLAWESEHVDGSGALASSDWPRWTKYIGPIPSETPSEKSHFGYVYLVQASTGECKIGASRNAQARLAQLQTASPVPLTLLHYFPATNRRPPEYWDTTVWGDIDDASARPISPTDEHSDYVPTQVIAEVFKTQGYDGVAYRSPV